MRKISIWAKNYKWPARIIIVAIHIILIGLAIFQGGELRTAGFIIPKESLWILLICFIAAAIAYPSKNRQRRPGTWSRFKIQKTCDIVIASTSFLIVLLLSNNPEAIFHSGNSEIMAASILKGGPEHSVKEKPYKSIGEFTASLKDKDGNWLKWKERKKLLHVQIKDIKNSDNSEAAKVGLIILSIFVALLLILTVAMLSCSISCGGDGSLAVIVFAGGSAAVIFLLIMTIRRIIRGKPKEKQLTEAQDT